MTLRLVGPHIQATGYRRGRARKRWPANGITFLALHTAEGATDEVALGHFFRNLGTASSNAGIGQDGGYASYVRYGDTAWTNPPIHDDTETLEMCGFARWSRKQWLAHPKMLDTVARWLAWRSKVRGIPLRRVEGANIARGIKGVVDHDGINDVFHQSSHWDIGENFPWDVVLPKAREYRFGSKGKDEPKQPVSEGKSYKVVRGDTYFGIARRAYGDGSLWPRIAQANRNRPLRPGMTITVPEKKATPASKPKVPVMGPWPGYDKVRPGIQSNKVRLLQRKLRHVVGKKKADQLNPNGATGYYGTETQALVSYALRNRPATWETGAKKHDGVVGPLSWRVIAGM